MKIIVGILLALACAASVALAFSFWAASRFARTCYYAAGPKLFGPNLPELNELLQERVEAAQKELKKIGFAAVEETEENLELRRQEGVGYAKRGAVMLVLGASLYTVNHQYAYRYFNTEGLLRIIVGSLPLAVYAVVVSASVFSLRFSYFAYKKLRRIRRA